MLRKVKNLLPLHIRKNLVQALVLSKLYYNDILHHSLPEYLTACLHKVQKAAASFVSGKYATTSDILKLNWLQAELKNANGIYLKVHTRVYTAQIGQIT